MDGPEMVGWRWLDSTATAHAGVVTELDIVLAFSASPEVLEQGLTKGPEVGTQAPQHGRSWQSYAAIKAFRRRLSLGEEDFP